MWIYKNFLWVFLLLIFFKPDISYVKTREIPQIWKNVEIIKTIDLYDPVIRETTSYTVENINDDDDDNDKSIKEYYYPIPEIWDKHLSYIEVKERETNKLLKVEKAIDPDYNNGRFIYDTKHIFVMEYSNVTGTIICGSPKEPIRSLFSRPSDNHNCGKIQFYKIHLGQQIKPKEKTSFIIETAYIHLLIPYPYEIDQNDKQYLLYRGNLYGNSAYFTERLETNLRLVFFDSDYHYHFYQYMHV